MATSISSAGGVRALLLTDIVDSTALAESLGEVGCAALWYAHDRAARELIRHWNGREIDKSDGLLVLFEVADDAVGFALAYHRALAALPTAMKARVGIHIGSVALRQNSAADVTLGAKPLEVDGVVKSIAARVMSIAQGGQTLVTANVHRALVNADLRLLSHGHWRVKGIAEPIELFEAGDTSLQFTPPPDGAKAHRVVRDAEGWLPLAELPNNLPQEATSFVGREPELGELRALLDGTRLLTLVGMGGLGKTRLLMRTARMAMPEFADGAWLAELAPITHPELVVQVVARALGVKEEAGRPLDAVLAEHVKDRRLLVLLDNCEHVVDACASLVNLLLRAGAGVTLIASSREPLRVAGEQVYPVPTMRLPEALPGAAPSSLFDVEALRLFADRARAVRPEFALTEDRATLVAEVCRRLDGIPLAIELAAARLRSMSLPEVAARLDQRMRLLTGGARAAQSRQKTLRSTIDWSHDLLDPSEQVLLRRLSVFAGGFWLEAAQAVCVGAGIIADDVLDLLASLVDKSLVVAEVIGDATRYRLLETMREYASEHLAASDDLATTHAHHQDHFLVLAESFVAHFVGANTGAWMARIECERDNLFAALAWSGGAASAERELRLAAAMGNFGAALGVLRQGYELTLRVLQRPACRVRTHWRSVAVCAAAQQAMHLARPVDAREHAEEALAIAREIADIGDVAGALVQLGYVATQQDECAIARRHFEEALAVAREGGGERLIASALGGLAMNMERAGDLEGAIRHYEETLLAWQRLDHGFNQATLAASLAGAYAAAGRLNAAQLRLRDALDLTRRVGAPRHLATFVAHNVAYWAAVAGRAGPAVRLYAALSALRPAAELSPLALDADELRLLERCRATHDAEALLELERVGRSMSYDQVLDEADAVLAQVD